MSKVVLQGTIIVPEQDLAAVVAALPLHAQLTRSEPGCLQSRSSKNRESRTFSASTKNSLIGVRLKRVSCEPAHPSGARSPRMSCGSTK